MSRRPATVRLVLWAYHAAWYALPGPFRRAWYAASERDLRDSLEATHAERGAPGVAKAGLAALWDVVGAIPREWRTAWINTTSGPAGPGRRGGGAMAQLIRDLGIAVRVLRRRPAYTMAAAWTLALGIGTTVAIFTVVNAVLLRPLPYPDAQGLVTIRHHAPGLELPELANSPGTLRLYRDQANYIEALGGFNTVQRNLIGGPSPERIRVVELEPEVLDVLRTAPMLGRAFNEADATPEGGSVLVLSHAFWSSRFGADPTVIGRTLHLDGRVVEVVGIMPRGFAFPESPVDAYAPFYIDPEGPFGAFGTGMVARLAPGVSHEAAQARTDELQARLSEMFELGDSFLEQAGWGVSVMRLQDLIVGEQVASTLWIVLGTVGFVFLIACANVANLFLVRAESRQKELAVRAAMGASGRRVASGFLAEALVLGVVGGVMGVALAWLAVDLLVTRGPQDLPRLAEVGLDATSLAFAGGISVLAALALGAIPMVRYAGRGLAGLLRDGGRASTDGRERHRARQVLVAGQLALAVVLLVGSGLMFRSFLALRAIDPGFDATDVLSVRMSLGEVPIPEGAAFYQSVADRVAALPGVTSVGLTSMVPVGSGSSNGGSFYIESRPREEDALPPVALYKAIGADYLETLRQPLLEGRALARADWESATPVALVNQAFADQFFDGQALGERIKWDEDRQFAEIVGIVGNVREYGLRRDVRAVAYLPLVVGDWPYPSMEAMTLLTRTAPGLAPPVAAVRDVVRSLNSDVPLASVETLDEVIAADMAETSFTMILLGIASGVAVFLGAIGLFGVISYVVGQRTREIGVRVALGAHAGEIRTMVFRQGAGVVGVGIVLGLVGAFALSSVMGAILFGVDATDPVVYALAPALLLVVAMSATWLPARRASRVDPVVALRAE